LTADQIVKLLAAKHAADVFVQECKDGPTVYGNHLRLDAWAMLKSWSNPISYGYEVKVDRGDFLRDTKWRNYLPLCTDFYFVCPSGLIKPEELPAEAGLLWVQKTGRGLTTKKKAPSRQVQVPEDLYRYILMCRLGPPDSDNREYRLGLWRARLESKRAASDISYQIKGKIREKMTALQDENNHIRQSVHALQDFRADLVGLGVDVENLGRWTHNRQEALAQVMAGVPHGFTADLGKARDALDRLIPAIEGLSKRKKSVEDVKVLQVTEEA